MSISLEYARGMVSSLYSSVGWKDRVSKMRPEQVLAIYRTSLNRGYFSKEKQQERRKLPEPDGNHQMTMFEYMEALSNGDNN